MRTQRAGSLTQGLVGAWCPSLGATGFRLQDRSGRNNHGTLTSMTGTDWVPSGGELALDFDGVDDHVSVGVWRNMELDYSVCAWLKTTYSGAATALLASSYNGAGGAHLMGVRGSDGALYTFDGAVESAFTGRALNDGLWRLAVIVRRFGLSMTGFVDGTQVGQNINSGLIGNASSLGTGWRIGGTPIFGANFPGQIDDFRIYNRALTAPEIRQLYIGGRGFGLIPERQRRRGAVAAAGFKAYRARRQSQLIGGGL